MKKLMLFAAAALMLFACSKDDNAPEGKLQQGDTQKTKFYATTEGTPMPGTKVFGKQEGTKLYVLWNEGDLISIFNMNTSNGKFEFDGDTGDNSGGFDQLDVNEPGTDLDHVYAVYPYSDDITINNDGSEISLTLPDEQTYYENSFGVGANTMVAVSNTNFLPFKNVCGYLRFRFYGNNITVKQLTLKGNNGEPLAGKAIVTPVFEGLPSVALQSETKDIITLTCEQPVLLGTTSTDYTEFIFVIPPMSLTKGFTVAVTTTDGKVFEKSYNKNVNIERSKITGMGAMEVTPNLNYELVKASDNIVDGNYVLAYYNGDGGYNLFSFTKTMANAVAAADMVSGDHGLEALLAKGSQIYAKVVGNNYVTVAGTENANYITVSAEAEAEAKLSVTGNANSAQLTLSDGTYSLRLDKVITEINSDYSATLAVQPNAADAINIMYALRGGRVVITFDDMIEFAISEAEKEGITFEQDQIDRLKSGFEHLCRLAKEEFAEHHMGDLMSIDLNTNVFDVIAQYYDNAAAYSLQISPEKKLGWATPIGFYAGDNGFTSNISLPNAGWFNRIDASLAGDTDAFIAYWKGIDAQYPGGIAGFNGFFEKVARKFVAEIDPSTYDLLQQVNFGSIGNVYAKYANRFNDKLEKVYLYKKIQ